MNKPKKSELRSKVYTDRPDYADFDAPAKFTAIQSIVAKHLKEHPHAICSYSGGANSDIMIDLIERTRRAFDLPPVDYAFFNTGLEMKATKDHVKNTARKIWCGDQVHTDQRLVSYRQTREIRCSRLSPKLCQPGLSEWQKKGIPLSIATEYNEAEDKAAKRQELRETYRKMRKCNQFLVLL